MDCGDCYLAGEVVWPTIPDSTRDTLHEESLSQDTQVVVVQKSPMKNSESTLFVVDDELEARHSINALASSLGISCETFASAEAFLERFTPSLSGCVLIDLVLEGLSGIELQTRLTEMGSTLPVILISAFADVPITVRAMRNGALVVLEKPYRANELTDAIREAFQVNRWSRQAGVTCGELQRRMRTLTARERHVMELVLADTPNRVIAANLKVGRRTVDRVRSTILQKMGTQSVVELAQQVGALRISRADNDHGLFAE